MSSVAFIPARGGSERVPGKNLAEVGGNTLVGLAVKRAWGANAYPVVSTDDDAIAVEAERLGAHIHRRHEYLSGPSVQIERVLHNWLCTDPIADQFTVLAILQPTSPLLSHGKVRECLDMVSEMGYPAAMTVCREAHFRGRIKADGDGRYRFNRNAPTNYRPRTQDMRLMGYETGGCYAFTREHFRETGNRLSSVHQGCVLVSKWEAIDVDDRDDLGFARLAWDAGKGWL